MNDLFGGDDRYADLLARIEALEAVVHAGREVVKAIDKMQASEPLNEAWQLWNRHRNGKGWTAEAKKRNMAKLKELAGMDGELALKIVGQSIEFGYQGLFPLKTPSTSIRNSSGNGSAPSAVQTKTVAQALAPSETKEERDRAYLANLKHLGLS